MVLIYSFGLPECWLSQPDFAYAYYVMWLFLADAANYYFLIILKADKRKNHSFRIKEFKSLKRYENTREIKCAKCLHLHQPSLM